MPKAFDVNEAGEDYQEKAGPMLTYDVQAAQADWAKAKEELGQETIELQLLTSDVGLFQTYSRIPQGRALRKIYQVSS